MFLIVVSRLSLIGLAPDLAAGLAIGLATCLFAGLYGPETLPASCLARSAAKNDAELSSPELVGGSGAVGRDATDVDLGAAT